MVRNEADIVRLNIRYHLSLGIDRLVVVDNGSTDGTDEVLEKARLEDSRVTWLRDDGPFLPSRVMTRLAREAFWAQADWVVPIDADEFWYAPRNDFRTVLRESKAGVLAAQTINFIQRRTQIGSSPSALSYMTRRVAAPVGPPGRGQTLVELHDIAFVEKMYPRKCVFRPTEQVEVETGHHKIYNADGYTEDTDKILCLHAPIRSKAALKKRIESAGRAAEAGRRRGQGRNRRRLSGLLGESALDREWAANSYQNGHLDVFGKRHPVVLDRRLTDAVDPFVQRPLWWRLYRRLGQTSDDSGA